MLSCHAQQAKALTLLFVLPSCRTILTWFVVVGRGSNPGGRAKGSLGACCTGGHVISSLQRAIKARQALDAVALVARFDDVAPTSQRAGVARNDVIGIGATFRVVVASFGAIFAHRDVHLSIHVQVRADRAPRASSAVLFGVTCKAVISLRAILAHRRSKLGLVLAESTRNTRLDGDIIAARDGAGITLFAKDAALLFLVLTSAAVVAFSLARSKLKLPLFTIVASRMSPVLTRITQILRDAEVWQQENEKKGDDQVPLVWEKHALRVL